MLSLTRHVGEKIIIGDNIAVIITEVANTYIKLGIDAADSVSILRSEVVKRNDDTRGNK